MPMVDVKLHQCNNCIFLTVLGDWGPGPELWGPNRRGPDRRFAIWARVPNRWGPDCRVAWGRVPHLGQVSFQMILYICFSSRLQVAKVTFVRFFSRATCQMSYQIVCSNRCKVTLVTFVWYISTVIFQMCSQIACLNRCKATSVKLVWFFARVSF